MSATKNVTGECQQCGGMIQFPADATGTRADCPLCGRETELMLATPDLGGGVPRKAIFFTSLALVILVGGWIAAQVAVKRTQRMAAEQTAARAGSPSHPSPAPAGGPFAAQGYHVGAVTLEKPASSSPSHAVGDVRNARPARRVNVRVELDLFDPAGRKVGTTGDQISVIESGGVWRFRAPVTDPRVARASLAWIKEGQPDRDNSQRAPPPER